MDDLNDFLTKGAGFTGSIDREVHEKRNMKKIAFYSILGTAAAACLLITLLFWWKKRAASCGC